ncbi:MAG: zinc ABC transporter substrate-binding protein, partial [Rhodospirillales bacterium]|nr:zinc ABC transporter substrate-binding protein [Rhodospirillales bacterium]
VGPALEGFLVQPLKALPESARIIQLSEHALLKRLPLRNGHDHRGEDGEKNDHADGHSETAYDPHLWLDPRNAQAIVALAVTELSAKAPLNAGRYRDNGAHMTRRLENLVLELDLLMRPVAQQPFMVFHDSFQYLEKAYGLNMTGFLTLSPEQSPGARWMKEIRKRIQHLGVRCLFREPSFEARPVMALARDTGLAVGVLDPLGAGLEPGADLYFSMMRENARSLTNCLKKTGNG